MPLLNSIPGHVVKRVLGDKAYDSKAIREALRLSEIDAVIPPRSNWKLPPACDMDAYKARHLVENAFADLKQFRGVATRYCKLAVTFSALVSLCSWVIATRTTHRGASPHAT